MDIFKMAWRNVWRSRRRTLVTIAAMSFALFAMILYAGLVEGDLRDMERSALDLEVGDVQVLFRDRREAARHHGEAEDQSPAEGLDNG